jgi:ribosomal protein L35
MFDVRPRFLHFWGVLEKISRFLPTGGGKKIVARPMKNHQISTKKEAQWRKLAKTFVVFYQF